MQSGRRRHVHADFCSQSSTFVIKKENYLHGGCPPFFQLVSLGEQSRGRNNHSFRLLSSVACTPGVFRACIVLAGKKANKE